MAPASQHIVTVALPCALSPLSQVMLLTKLSIERLEKAHFLAWQPSSTRWRGQSDSAFVSSCRCVSTVFTCAPAARQVAGQ